MIVEYIHIMVLRSAQSRQRNAQNTAETGETPIEDAERLKKPGFFKKREKDKKPDIRLYDKATLQMSQGDYAKALKTFESIGIGPIDESVSSKLTLREREILFNARKMAGKTGILAARDSGRKKEKYLGKAEKHYRSLLDDPMAPPVEKALARNGIANIHVQRAKAAPHTERQELEKAYQQLTGMRIGARDVLGTGQPQLELTPVHEGASAAYHVPEVSDTFHYVVRTLGIHSREMTDMPYVDMTNAILKGQVNRMPDSQRKTQLEQQITALEGKTITGLLDGIHARHRADRESGYEGEATLFNLLVAGCRHGNPGLPAHMAQYLANQLPPKTPREYAGHEMMIEHTARRLISISKSIASTTGDRDLAETTRDVESDLQAKQAGLEPAVY